jgi:antitoxin (DNA-binding transcriptional repressor) of toxin-antitoxin stability system
VEAGERVEITRDGKPVALIVPVPADPLSRLVAEGHARPALRPVRPQVPATAWPLDRSSTEIISEGREDRF